MNKNEAEAILKETIEYANNEIIKNKKRNRKKMIIVLSLVAIFLIIGFITGEKKTEIITIVNVEDIQGTSQVFDESVFSKMDITYTESGAPIVDDTNASAENYIPNIRCVSAKTMCDTWGYGDEGLSTNWFVIPKGRVVTVLSNNLSNGAIEIEYAGVILYIRGSYVTLY